MDSLVIIGIFALWGIWVTQYPKVVDTIYMVSMFLTGVAIVAALLGIIDYYKKRKRQ